MTWLERIGPFSALLVATVWAWLRTLTGTRDARRVSRVEQAMESLAAADFAALHGAWSTMEPMLESVSQTAAITRDQPGPRLRAHLGLLRGEWLAARGDAPGATDALTAAMREADAILDERLSMELRVRIMAGLEMTGLVDIVPENTPARRGWALSHETEVVDPSTLARLARLALRQGRAAIDTGDWPCARARFEQAVAMGDRLKRPDDRSAAFGETRERLESVCELVHADASQAAIDLGAVLVSLGRRDEGIPILQHAIDTMDGATSPAGRAALAAALVSRATAEPVDPLVGPGIGLAMLERATREGVASCRRDGLEIACRAGIQAGLLYGSFGDHVRAAEAFRQAHDAVREAPGTGAYATHALLLLGMALATQGDTDGACNAWRQAFERGAADPDPQARHLAVVAGGHLHRRRLEAGDLDDARALIERIDRVVPVVTAATRSFAAGVAARERGYQLFRDGDHDAAEASLVLAERLADEDEDDASRRLKRGIAADLARLAMARGRFDDAETHVRRALAVTVARPDQPEERGERAELLLGLAQALLRQHRPEDAIVEARRSFEIGRGSGTADGRGAASMAALMLADLSDAPVAERRRLYIAAGDLGRLSQTRSGREVSEAVSARLAALDE
ncbi:MAG: hypothetical protein ACHQ52_04315 [Candidatus Eisenbacteria bacterium]